MRRTVLAVPRGAAAAARHAAARRRGVLVLLLVLAAFLGMALEPCAAAVRGTPPPPPLTGSRDPSGDGQGEVQQDTADTEQATPARIQRAGRARVEPPAPLGSRAVEPAPYTTPCGPAVTPRVPGSSRCAVLRC
ncbi:hypothetical protein [Streptomyces corynorhini]|uniref:Uncharacterized protein n=1 Tax=Streptomyces corynorhini TaxID=2282652 RepID=A0A370B3Q0_9ACTN|nr:hypothetical protein [Streptomyces corynorhini]RDG36438.1 hypothetical protein DVH02_20115 [Streptomyces corynorhini]